jgi:hypothetical protein
MTQIFNIEKFLKPSPWFWTLVTDDNHGRAEVVFNTQDDATNAFLRAKKRKTTYSATLWQQNVESGSCVKIADHDRA